MCEKHHFGMQKPSQIQKGGDQQGKKLQKTWNSIKSAAENVKPKKVRAKGSGVVELFYYFCIYMLLVIKKL